MRSLAFGPHEKYVHRMGCAVAAFQPRDPLSDLAEWERALRPSMAGYQQRAMKQRKFFVPATRFQIAMRRVITHGMNKPVASHLIRQLQVRGARIKEKDIAAV